MDTIVNVHGVFEYITLLTKITRSILTHLAESYPGIIPFYHRNYPTDSIVIIDTG